MTALSTKMAKTAQRLVGKYGATVVITRRVAGTFNPTTQTESGGSTITDTVKATIDDYRAYEVNGDTIQYGDKKILIPSLELTNLVQPKPDDIISVNSVNYRVIGSSGLSAGDSMAAYTVQARR